MSLRDFKTKKHMKTIVLLDKPEQLHWAGSWGKEKERSLYLQELAKPVKKQRSNGYEKNALFKEL